MRTKDFEQEIPEEMDVFTSGIDMCRSVQGWPEDELAHWLSSHREDTRRILCGSDEYKGASFCA
ncbi:MAG: hypothetical protein FJ118_17765 [Deltaproteobacteria bacterium]|nr:hypothetical protein [Deltaproteobacteria bacterium]